MFGLAKNGAFPAASVSAAAAEFRDLIAGTALVDRDPNGCGSVAPSECSGSHTACHFVVGSDGGLAMEGSAKPGRTSRTTSEGSPPSGRADEPARKGPH